MDEMFKLFKRKAETATPLIVGEATMRAALLDDALTGLADTFRLMGTAEAGGHFTCSEADALAKVLVVAGHRNAAISWLEGHAYGDDDEDDVHPDVDIAEYVDALV
ncbi:hypothetical protein ACIPX0_26480 [Streptomyces sp. NPDC090075]|uniref:hypothetical protein n=1 Tax=Streptomyces sp. NPDC090075 TaxID=3365937 RepID=UPI003830DA59